MRLIYYFKSITGSFLSLIKILQTALLVLTGIAGFMSFGKSHIPILPILNLTGSLFLAISGCTILNMVYDRDIDLKMTRTASRPIPNGDVSPVVGNIIGILITLAGILWAFLTQIAYGWIVTAGVFFDVIIYTMWLRRRTPFSVLLGGLSGGMPILAGRVLAAGQIDMVGLVLSTAVLVWIPIHTLTLHLKHQSEFTAAGIPTFSGKYGEQAARILITISAGLSAVVMVASGWLLNLGSVYLSILSLAGIALLLMLITSLFRTQLLKTKLLFRSASLFMLLSMVLIVLARL